MTLDDIRNIISNRLQEHGWEIFEPPTVAIAFKMYETAVGKREAQVYLQDWGDEGGILAGQYESKGNNILSTANEIIPLDVNEDALNEQIDRFAKEVELRVSESYAVRLLNLNQDEFEEDDSVGQRP